MTTPQILTMLLASVSQLHNPKGDSEPPKSFTFDQVYNWDSSQADIFDITARGIIDSAMEGYNGEGTE